MIIVSSVDNLQEMSSLLSGKNIISLLSAELAQQVVKGNSIASIFLHKFTYIQRQFRIVSQPKNEDSILTLKSQALPQVSNHYLENCRSSCRHMNPTMPFK